MTFSITIKQMKKLDKLMIEYYNLNVTRMMEIAGLTTALMCQKIVGKKLKKKIILFAGKGNNGGDTICAARHLMNFGFQPVLVLIGVSSKLKKDPKEQLKIYKKIKGKLIEIKKNKEFNKLEKELKKADLIIDGLIGYNLKGQPHGLIAKTIEKINSSNVKVLAIDVPSGLNTTTGKFENCVKANYTLTLSLPKKGLLKKQAKQKIGKLYLSYMTVPDALYKKLGLKISNKKLFSKNLIVRIN